jgi:hypothetical protein
VLPCARQAAPAVRAVRQGRGEMSIMCACRPCTVLLRVQGG